VQRPYFVHFSGFFARFRVQRQQPAIDGALRDAAGRVYPLMWAADRAPELFDFGKTTLWPVLERAEPSARARFLVSRVGHLVRSATPAEVREPPAQMMAALEAVLRALGAVDRMWCLGDVVGYGPNPNESIEMLLALPNLDVCLTGNHDAAVIGSASVADFNPEAQQAVLWTREQLTPASDAFLRERLAKIVHDGEFTLAHASPREPIWEYVTNTALARENFPHFTTTVCLVGHTHVPAIFSTGKDRIVRLQTPRDGIRLDLRDGRRYIVNPGSVGQPRDNNTRAAYAILDSAVGILEFHRIAYDIAETQRRMQAAHLPAKLIARLDYGW